MIAYRAVTRMMQPLITGPVQGRIARKLLRALLTSDADVIPEPEAGILRVRFLGLGSDACEQSPAPSSTNSTKPKPRNPGAVTPTVRSGAVSETAARRHTRKRSSRPLPHLTLAPDKQFPAYVFGNLFDFPGHPRLQPKFPFQSRPQREQQIAGRGRLDQIAHPL